MSGETAVQAVPDAAPQKVSGREAYLQQNAERMEQEYDGNTVDESDTLDEGTPDESMESDAGADGALAADTTDETEADIDDDTPAESESDAGVWEERYKDTQAKLTETSQELSRMRSEESEAFGELTGARFEMNQHLDKAKAVAEYWGSLAEASVRKARAIDFSQVPPDQIGQAQQFVRQAEIQYQQTMQQMQQTLGQVEQAKKEATAKEVAIARAQLTRQIPDFDTGAPGQTGYDRIREFAVQSGVNPQVMNDITDPGLIALIHGAMTVSSAPDTIETVTKKTQVKRKAAQNLRVRDEAGRFKQADQKFRSATTKAQRKQAYLERENSRFRKEYDR